MSRDDPQMKLRLPEALRNRIRDAAQSGGRSMNAEILSTLGRAYPREGTALDFARDLFSYYMHSSHKFSETDVAAIEELFDSLFEEIHRLQAIENETIPEDQARP